MKVEATLHEPGKPSISVKVEWNAEPPRLTQNLDLTIAIGDDWVLGAVTLPFDILTVLVARVMEQKNKRDQLTGTSSIIITRRH